MTGDICDAALIADYISYRKALRKTPRLGTPLFQKGPCMHSSNKMVIT